MKTRSKPPPVVRLKTPIRFKAAPVSGAGRGKKLGYPTLNLDLSMAPADLKEGIYACRVWLDGQECIGAMHYGYRPVFKDSLALEVHVIDRKIIKPPLEVEVEVIAKLRDVFAYSSPEALTAAIAHDVALTRAMLGR